MNAEELMNPDTPDHNKEKKKKKKKPDQTDQNPDTAALINPNQPRKSHRNKNLDTADQPRSRQEKKKKKKPRSTLIKTQTPSLLDQCFLHRWST